MMHCGVLCRSAAVETVAQPVVVRSLVDRRVCSLLCFLFFFFNDTATTAIYTLSLHDALPIYPDGDRAEHLRVLAPRLGSRVRYSLGGELDRARDTGFLRRTERAGTCGAADRFQRRSEEHTSELQSHSDLVCRLLLEKKKKKAQ